MRRIRLIPVMAFAVLFTACASGGSGEGRTRVNPNVISADELVTVANLSVYDAIQRLRPQWLQSRSGAAPVVHMNGSQIGGLGQLRSISASTLSQIRYQNGRDATTRYGTGYGGGVIEMTTKG